MAMARCVAASGLNLPLPYGRRSHAPARISRPLLAISTSKIRYGFSAKLPAEGLPSFKTTAKKIKDIQTSVPTSLKPTPPKWLVSFALSVLSLVLPGWKIQLQTILKLEEEAEKLVEETAVAIETIAEATEKVMEEVEHDLPADSKLRKGILMIENATEEAEKDAKLALDLIHKVDEIKEQVEEVIEPIINPGEFVKKEA